MVFTLNDIFLHISGLILLPRQSNRNSSEAIKFKLSYDVTFDMHTCSVLLKQVLKILNVRDSKVFMYVTTCIVMSSILRAFNFSESEVLPKFAKTQIQGDSKKT